MIWIKPAVIIALLLAFAGCAKKNPLGPSSNGPGSLSGTINVTVYNGSAVETGQPAVALLLPDGSQRQAAASSQGKASFTGLNEAGTYRVGLANQPSANPAWVSVALSAAHASENLVLQVGGVSLSVVAAPFQNNWFPFQQEAFHYTVFLANAPAYKQDLMLDVDPSTLPANWSCQFGQQGLADGQQTMLTVVSANETTAAGVTLTVRAKLGAAVVASQVLSLTRNWSLNLDIGYSNYGHVSGPSYTGWWQNAAALPSVLTTLSLKGTNIPPLYSTVAPLDGPGRLVQPRNISFTAWCDNAAQCSSSTGDYQPAVWNIQVNGPSVVFTEYGSWYNTGWTLWEIMTTSHWGQISFLYEVHVGDYIQTYRAAPRWSGW